MCSSEILTPIISTCSALAGVWVGKWLERSERDRQFKRESLFQVNKFVLIWADTALAKLPFELGTTEEYLREVSDRALEAQALLEVIGSVSLNLAFDDLRNAVVAMSHKAMQYKTAGRLNPNKGIQQFTGELELEAYRSAKRKWIDTLRKEVGGEAVKIE